MFSAFLNTHKNSLRSLAQQRRFFITGFSSGGLLQDESWQKEPQNRFISEELSLLGQLINSAFWEEYPHPVLIDAVRAVAFLKHAGAHGLEDERRALLFSRINFMGTDGMRGKVSLDSSANCLASFLQENLLQPELIRLGAYSFARMLRSQEMLGPGDMVCVCNDGRDLATGWKLRDAMIEGFHRAGSRVMDLGVGPTPMVPFRQLREGIAAGAMLTASHNPANQNGIKFFLEGQKILPEGVFGDYSLAAWIYDSAMTGIPRGSEGEMVSPGSSDSFLDHMVSALPQGLPRLLEDTILILDHANGAFANWADRLFEKLHLPVTCVSETPTGSNINAVCGVAEIEGNSQFTSPEERPDLRIISEMFRQGRQLRGDVFGFVLDGDGDRGFLLHYHGGKDLIQVLDGDKAGYLLAKYLLKSNPSSSGGTFVLTVESDIMTSYHASRDLGVAVKIVSVGDKWIGACQEELLVGLESSGHLIVPLPFTGASGRKVVLRGGNGLLTCLWTLGAVKSLGLSADRIGRPYDPGFSKTFYTYFVDKSRFYRDSTIWQTDRTILEKGFYTLQESHPQLDDLSLIFEEKEDPHMLYASLVRSGSPVGSFFIRNSGTEDKIAVYIKCHLKLEPLLCPLGVKIHQNHRDTMKNQNCREFIYERIIEEELIKTGEVELSRLKKIVQQNISEEVNTADFSAVLYAMKKEGRLGVNGKTAKLLPIRGGEEE